MTKKLYNKLKLGDMHKSVEKLRGIANYAHHIADLLSACLKNIDDNVDNFINRLSHEEDINDKKIN